MAAVQLPSSLIELGFAPSPDPFDDIAVVQLRPGAPQEKTRRTFWAPLESRGLSVVESFPRTYTVTRSTKLSPGPAYSLSGIVMPDGGDRWVARGPAELDEAGAGRARDRVGNFTLFEVARRGIRISTDYFGLGALYTLNWSGGAIVSNRAHLAAILIAALGLDVKASDDHLLTLLLEHGFFTWQGFSDGTPIEGLRKVPVGHFVWMKDGHAELRGEFKWSGDSGLTDAQLRELASFELQANANAIPELFPGRTVVMDVSGGFDSRLALAAVAATDMEFLIRTHDTAPGTDLAVSAIIASTLDLDYVAEPAAVPVPLRPEVALAQWRSYMMGEYNNLGFSQWSNAGMSTHVRVTGAAGELHRGFWDKALAGFIDRYSIESLPDLARVVVRERTPMLDRVAPEYRDTLEAVLLRAVSELSDVEFSEALYRHYVLYRNRTHFGLRLYSTYNDAFFYMPLLSRSLFELSQRSRGRVGYDETLFRELTRSLHPVLGSLPYEKDALPDELVRRSGLKLDQWRSAEKFALASRAAAGDSGAQPMNSADEALTYAVDIALERISSRFPQADELLSVVHRNYRSKLLDWPREARNLAARVLAVDSYLHPLDQAPLEPGPGYFSAWSDPIGNIRVDWGRDRTDVSVYLLEGVEPERYEFAVDLKSEGQRLVQVWYGPDRHFTVPHEDPVDEVVCFVRPRGASQVFYRSVGRSAEEGSRVEALAPESIAGRLGVRRLVRLLRVGWRRGRAGREFP